MNKEKPSYYAIIPASVRYDKNLKPNEKLMFGEITALCNKNGYCHASNKYFSELYDVQKETISRWIKKLSELNYIKVKLNYAEGTNQIVNRYIYLCQHPIDIKVNTPIDKKVKDNTINNNTTSNNTTSNNKGASPKNFTKKEFRKVLLDLDCEPEILEDWLKVRQKKKAVFSKTALKAFINECNKNNYPVKDAVQKCAENSWAGFKYEWVKNIKNGKQKRNTENKPQYSDAFKERLLKKLQS